MVFNIVPINTIYSCTFVPTPDLRSPLADLRARYLPPPDDMRVPQWTRLAASVSLGFRSSTTLNLLLLPPFPSAHHVRTLTRSRASQVEGDDSVRIAKSASDWGYKDLSAYNITIIPQTKKQFFGSTNLPAPTNPSISEFMKVKYHDGAEDVNEQTRKLLHYFDYACNPKVGKEAAVDEFAKTLLANLDYDIEKRTIFIRHALPFAICGTDSLAQTDVCIKDAKHMHQEDGKMLNAS
ncbi:hypothetical protein BC826DRAFT_1106997 [Russula brevipes]|nr:hypothetical protein BC826DRAFT_1106997 [Russula brevipes]